jgi:integrative and conjugative element protein (TIGR02256 family)
MQILLPASVAETITLELRKSGKRETGGLLFAEHIGGDTFKIIDVTTQQSRGTVAEFVRDPTQHKEQLEALFERTGNDCTRFNYFGEWHSHPCFAPIPSGQDLRTMCSILRDPEVGANFLVLLIIRLNGISGLALSATICDGSGVYQPASVFVEARCEVPQKRRMVRAL